MSPDDMRLIPLSLIKAMVHVFGRDALKASVRVVLSARRGRPQKSRGDDCTRMWRAGMLEDDGMTPWAALMAVLVDEGITDARERKKIFMRIAARGRWLAKAPIVAFREPDADEVERWAKLIETGLPSYKTHGI